MSADGALEELARRAGVHAVFRDMNGVERVASPETRRALLTANGLPAATEAEVRESLELLDAEAAVRLIPDDVIVPAGQPSDVALTEGADWQVLGEDRQAVFAVGRSDGHARLPAMEVGFYLLQVAQGDHRQEATLLVTPPHAPSVTQITGKERQWGVVAALFALQSARNGGIGDFRDLGDLAHALGGQGAGFLGINPVHALGWQATTTISPYSPTHRGFLNTGHIALDALDGAAAAVPGKPGRDGMLDYASHAAHHRQALQAAFQWFEAQATAPDRAAFDAFVADEGARLQDFARFEALSTLHGADSRHWPAALQDPAGAPGTVDLAEERFHCWLQWIAHRQLEAAQARARAGGMALGLYLDLAVGARLGGAEYWANAPARATGVSIGAPPDDLSPAGQNWGLGGYAPRKLTATRYASLRQILAQSMRHCGILRIDHALGLNRSFWLPDDGTPGGYISQPFDALLAVVAIEAWKAGTVVVGEDLGLVPEGFRERIARAGLYGYTVLQFERDAQGRFRKPCELRPHTLACFGTHDTPTLRGFWEGHDIEWWHHLSWIDAAGKERAQTRRADEKKDLMGLPGDAPAPDADFAAVRHRIHEGLAQAPTALSAVQLDDLLALKPAQNLPGTVDEHPNWRRAYPAQVGDLAALPALRETATLMRAAGRGSDGTNNERTGHED